VPYPRATLVVRWLEPDVAEDIALASIVADVVNRGYAHAETGLFLTKIDRTDAGDVTASISRRETAVALLDGLVVGSIRVATLDERTSWFGALGVDPAVRGLGDTLVTFVEDDAVVTGWPRPVSTSPRSPWPRALPTSRTSGSPWGSRPGTSSLGARTRGSFSSSCGGPPRAYAR